MTWKLELKIDASGEGQVFYDTEGELLAVLDSCIPRCEAHSLQKFNTDHGPGVWKYQMNWIGCNIVIEGTEVP